MRSIFFFRADVNVIVRTKKKPPATNDGEQPQPRTHRPGGTRQTQADRRRPPTPTPRTHRTSQKNDNQRRDPTRGNENPPRTHADDPTRGNRRADRRTARNRHNQAATADREGNQNDNRRHQTATDPTDTTTQTEPEPKDNTANTSHAKARTRQQHPRHPPRAISTTTGYRQKTTTDGLGGLPLARRSMDCVGAPCFFVRRVPVYN